MGRKEGGQKAAITNKLVYGEDFYVKIGAISGRKGKADGVIKGFAAMPKDKVREAGRLGGTISRKGNKVNEDS